MGSLRGGCSAWLVCWKGQHKDEPAGGSAGGFFLVPGLPGPFLSLKLPPNPWGGRWDPVTSLPFLRATTGVMPLPSWDGGWGPELDPPCWVGADARAACESPGAAPPAGGCFTLSTALQGVGVGRYYCRGKIASSSALARSGYAYPPGRGPVLAQSWAATVGSGSAPQDPPTEPRQSPSTPRRWSRQLPAAPAPQPVNLAAWPQGAGSN